MSRDRELVAGQLNLAGQPYKPSNSTDGYAFIEGWCAGCEKDRAFRESDGEEQGCLILLMTMTYDEDFLNCPQEWIYDSTESPVCTAYLPAQPPGSDPLPVRCDFTVDMFEEDE